MASISSLVPELQPWAKKLLDLANSAGVRPVLTSARRSHAAQQRLYETFLAGHSKFPVAPPGTSAHEYGFAFDVTVDNDTDLADLGSVWESWGGVWGGRYGDPVHFEFPGFQAPTASGVHGSAGCGKVSHALLQTVDFILGFVPGLGEVELAAWLLSFGFKRSEVLQWLQNPVTSSICGLS